MLSLRHVTKRYGAGFAITDSSLEFPAGRFVSILGPSGCGKSTLLRIMAGLTPCDAGEVWLDGRDVTRLPANRRNLNMVFQDYALFPHLNVAENVAFGLRLKGVGKSEAAAQVERLLQLVQLEGYGERPSRALSGGQQQRVALARALAPDPLALLLDEPLGALDAKLRQTMQTELKSIQRRTGKTFVLVTHDQDEALTISDTLIVMNAGRVMQAGSPQQLYDHPASRFVASFLGSINLLDAVVAGREGDRLALDYEGGRVACAVPGVAPVAGAPVTLGLRPEAIRLSETPRGDGNEIRVRIVEARFKGDHSSLDLVTERGTPLQAQVPRDEAVRPDSAALWARWDPARLTVIAD